MTLTLDIVRSQHNPDVIKVVVGGSVNRVGVVGETLQVHLGIDAIDYRLAASILRGRVCRADGRGGDVSSGAMREIENALLDKLLNEASS